MISGIANTSLGIFTLLVLGFDYLQLCQSVWIWAQIRKCTLRILFMLVYAESPRSKEVSTFSVSLRTFYIIDTIIASQTCKIRRF